MLINPLLLSDGIIARVRGVCQYKKLMLIITKLLQKLRKYSNLLSMSQDKLIKLTHKKTGETIFTTKNKKNSQEKLELKKYSKKLRKTVVFKEAKK